jgi:hypothetical protein
MNTFVVMLHKSVENTLVEEDCDLQLNEEVEEEDDESFYQDIRKS